MATRTRTRSRSQSAAVVGLSVGTRCYIPDAARVWLPVTVEYVNPAQQTVTLVVDKDADSGGEHGKDDGDAQEDGARRVELSLLDATFPLQNPRALHPSGYADMIELNHLHEAAILDNLTRRFHAQLPYTFTGEICLAVNPYQWLEELYRPELHAQYLHASSRKRLPPHVYTVSVAAFKHMTRHERNQSILVSGESGAGKTETTKILMDNLAHIGRHKNREESSTIARILEVNPLLESFGNAKTKRNDNSSRFGKFTQLQFTHMSSTSSVLVGARCETYLLEKSRVVTQEKGERNYHIFYQLLHGCEDVGQRRALGLPAAASRGGRTFAYLIDDDVALQEKDRKGFAKTKRALTLLGLDDAAQQTLFRVLVGVLQLGEVSFFPRPDNDDASTVDNDSTQAASELLGLDLAAMEKALCMRTMRAVREVYSVPLNVEQASSSRDALAKALYAKVFDWMVVTINASLSSSHSSLSNSATISTIGVLDIFGFESFVHNSFEQLCINYANEKLQQKFTQDVFKAVQDEYASEEITWDHIAYADNADVLALIEGRMGILALLNEEIVRPKGSDESFVGKLAASMRGPVGAKPATVPAASKKKIIEFPRVSRTQFTIHHYAAAVKYEATGFLEKHKDALLPDLAELMRGSHVPFVCELFPAPEESAPSGPKPKRGAAGGDSQTVGTQFKQSLNRLMESINETNVHYIRCIKPNSEKSPSLVDAPMVVNQLRCAGVIEAISIARAGYPTRMRHSEFVDAFELFLTRESDRQRVRDGTHDSRKLCVALCRDEFQLTSPEQFQMGKTKIYLQQGVLEQLEATKAERLFRSAACIQSHWRGLVLRRRFREMVTALLVLQRRMHVAVASRRFQRMRRSVRLVQRVWRGHVARCEFRRRRRERCATRLQCAWRVVVARRRLQQLRRAFEMEQARLRLIREREEAEERRRKQQEAERLRREQERRERLERERLERERLEKERLEKERLERERLEKARLERERMERIEKERLERERVEHAAVTVQRIARGGLVRQQFAKLQLEEEVLARKRRELEEQEQLERQQNQLPALHIRKSTSLSSSGVIEKTAESPEVVAAREENARLRKQLEELLETNIELETLVSEWSCEREVLKASSHVQQTELKHQIAQQRQNLETARNEYATLRAYMEEHSDSSRMRMLRRASSAAGTSSSSSSARSSSSWSWRRQPSNATSSGPRVSPPADMEDDNEEEEDDEFPMDDGGVKEDSSSEEEDARGDDDDMDDDDDDAHSRDDRQSANIASFLNRSTFTQRMQNRRGESVRWLRAGAKQLSRAKEMMATQSGGRRTISGRSESSNSNGESPSGDQVHSPPRTMAKKKSGTRLPFRWKSQSQMNGAS
ncbi:hypothetical protein PINS_up014049 [Pythium insidiosum]|nr:hypothetical protein PINS_up014049 [Pythium insidiosum]